MGYFQILDRDLSTPGSHGRYLKELCGDSQARTVVGHKIFRSP
jgi:hypothetical protein